MINQSIKSWTEDERPREKLQNNGASTLSLSELLAIIINTGSREKSAVELAKELLKSANNDLNTLARFSIADYKKIKGIGDAKAISIVACIEISRRKIKTETASEKIIGIEDSVNHFIPLLQDKAVEEFWILFLRKNNTIIRSECISKGGTTATYVDNKIIIQKVIENKAESIILAHNHPSGNTKPSDQDVKLTKKIHSILQLMDVAILDHIIIANNKYYSFAENGMMHF